MLATMIAALSLALLPPGATVPDVAAPNQDGKLIRLSQLRGRPVLVYFYPKDDTPGCTREAQGLRDDYAKFQALGVVVLGVSRQDAASHRAFRAKHELPFDLLVDADGSFAKALGVGTYPIVGLHKRQSLLIGADGKVVRSYEDVDPAAHSAEVLAAVAAASGGK